MKVDSHNRVAITGYGSITAAGHNSEAAQTSILQGLIRTEVLGTEFFPKNFSAPCFRVADEWVEQGASAEEILAFSSGEVKRTISLALIAIKEGLVKAGYTLKELQDRCVGIAIGTTVGCTFHNEEYYKAWREHREPDRAALIAYLSSNLAACIQNILGLRGPRAVITNACASGTDAIGVAKCWLQLGLCDVAIAGGADEFSRIACHGFRSLMLVSDRVCTPFDRKRQGLNLGEGAGILVMEPESAALRRNARLYGRVLGYGIAGDAYHPTAPHPEGRGLQSAVRAALQDAGLKTDHIAMINGHGTGTSANDTAETNAIAALGFRAERVPVVSTKGITGHTLGAAGGVEAVFTLMALNANEVVGTVGCTEQDPTFAHRPLGQGEKAALSGKIGLSQSLAFGGNNAALVLEGNL